MGKLTSSAKTNLTNSQKTRKSDSSITKQLSSSSTQRRGNAPGNSTHRTIATTSEDKENTTNHSKSSSDISDDEAMESQTTASTPPRKPSAVHEYATKLSPNEYQCKLCSKIIRCTVDTNSNIRRHLALSHGKVQLACRSHRPARMTISPDKKKLLDQAALTCIISDARSWNDFKRPGMSKFLAVAVPGYTGPSSRTVQRKLTNLYLQKQHDFKNELDEVENVSITTDLWRSSRCHHYLCITVHWLNSNYQLNAKVLSFRKFKGRHLSIRIRRHIQRVLSNFNLTNKIVASTTDNGSNVKAATSLIRLFGIRFHCMAHALNLTIHKGLQLWRKKDSTLKQKNIPVNDKESFDSDDDASDDDALNDSNEEPSESNCNSDDEDEDEQFDQDDDSSTSSSTDDEDDENNSSSSTLMDDITALMERCRIIVVTIRKSSILYEFVQNLAADSSIKAGLIIDMKVRWNSSYKMLQRILLYQPVLDKLYEELNSLPGITEQQRKKLINSKLNGNDWTLVQVVRRVLERFDEATKVLSGQKYPTLSLSYAIIFSLLHYLNSQSADNLENEVKGLLLNSYNQYMIRDGKEMAVIRVAALLDPLTHDLLTAEDKHAAESFIVKEINDKRRSKNASISDTSTTASNTSTDTNGNSIMPSVVNPSKSVLVINNFLNKCGVGSTNTQISSRKSLTIQQGLSKLSSIPKDDYEFTSFWQEHGKALPKLASLARKYLPVSSTNLASDLTILKTQNILSGIDDLKNGKIPPNRIGIRVGTAAVDYYLQEISNGNPNYYPLYSLQQSYDYLLAGIIDVTFTDIGIGEYVTDNIYCNLTLVGAAFDAGIFGIAVAKDWIYTEELDVTILSMGETGVLNNLQTKWFQTKICPDTSGIPTEIEVGSMGGLFATFVVIGLLTLLLFVWNQRQIFKKMLSVREYKKQGSSGGKSYNIDQPNIISKQI